MFPHSALPCVASFPPAALPAFIGTTRLSDSLCRICLLPSSVVRHTLCSREAQGLPGCRVIIMSDMPWSQTPGKLIPLALTEIPVLTSTVKIYSVSFYCSNIKRNRNNEVWTIGSPPEYRQPKFCRQTKAILGWQTGFTADRCSF